MLKSLAGRKLAQASWNGPHRAVWIGAVCGAGAALGYAIANTFLRQVATSMDPVWVSTVKAACTVLIFGPWLAYLACIQRAAVLPAGSMVLWLIFAGIQVQVVGNVAFQWALGKIGLALVVPLVLGAMILGSAVAGRWWLGERIHFGTTLALIVLFVAIVLLSGGTRQAGLTMAEQVADSAAHADRVTTGIAWGWGAGAVAACMSGLSYALLGIIIRVSLRSRIPLATPMIIVGLSGVLGLGAWSLAMYGTAVITRTTGAEWAVMLSAGGFNAAAFLCLTMSLKLLPVVYVNAINVSQVALAALVGLLFFGEALSPWLIAGLLVMSLGFGLLAYSSSRTVRVPTSPQVAGTP